MHLSTMFAPPSFSDPVLVIDTWYAPGSGVNETMMALVEALNVPHAQRIVHAADKAYGQNAVEWVRVKKHRSLKDATAFHLRFAERLHNGGSLKAWQESQPAYDEAVELIESKRKKEAE